MEETMYLHGGEVVPVGADEGGDPGVVGHDAVACEQRGAGHAQHQLTTPQVARRREAPPAVEARQTRWGERWETKNRERMGGAGVLPAGVGEVGDD